ncbi:MAG TPA: alpha-N-acetylglucosaminidase C-terminal domain-containing protein, partial [Lacunisphaera sp.]
EFLLGSWLNEARHWGATPAEQDYFEENAREIVTAWHMPGAQLTDYASRQWNGLMRDYYLPRWEKWIALTGEALEHGTPFPEQEYIAWVNAQCAAWIHAHGAAYASAPQGDPVEISRGLFAKYRARLEHPGAGVATLTVRRLGSGEEALGGETYDSKPMYFPAHGRDCACRSEVDFAVQWTESSPALCAYSP